MNLILLLDSHGIAIQSSLQRIGGNLLLYCKLCDKFLDDLSYSRINEAILKESYQDLLLHLHTLKGVSANLGFLQLEYLCKVCLKELHDENYPMLNLSFQSLSCEYNKIRELILAWITPILDESKNNSAFPDFS